MAWQIPQNLWKLPGTFQEPLLRVFQSLQQYMFGHVFANARSTSAPTPDGVTPIIQAASTVGTTDAGGGLTIAFPTPFPNGLIAVVGINGDHTATPNMKPEVYGPGTTPSQVNFTIMVANTGAVIASSAVRVDWIAVGW